MIENVLILMLWAFVAYKIYSDWREEKKRCEQVLKERRAKEQYLAILAAKLSVLFFEMKMEQEAQQAVDTLCNELGVKMESDEDD